VHVQNLVGEAWVSFDSGATFTKQNNTFNGIILSPVASSISDYIFLTSGKRIYRASLKDTFGNPPPGNQLIWEGTQLDVAAIFSIQFHPTYPTEVLLHATSPECVRARALNCSNDVRSISTFFFCLNLILIQLA